MLKMVYDPKVNFLYFHLEVAPCPRKAAFSLVEVLITVAVIAIISMLILPQILGVRNNANLSTARQQQAQLQTALGNWITTASSQSGGLAGARTTYNAAANKLTLLQNYLQAATYANLQGSGNNVSSTALTASGASLQFSTWTVGGSPSILWVNSP